MVFDATGVPGVTQRLWEQGVRACTVTFVERPFRANENRGVYGEAPDLNRLRRWLRGDATVREDASGMGPACHLVSGEYLDRDGLTAVLKVYREEAPDVQVLVYDPHVRVSPLVPGAEAIQAAAIDARRPWEMKATWAPEVYLLGQPAGSAGGRDPYRVNEEWSLADLPRFVEFARLGVERAGLRGTPGPNVVPAIHERYHPGWGLRAEVFLSPNAWRVYTAAVLRAFGCVVWWSAPVYGFTQDGKLAYVPQTLEQLEPYVDTLASEALRLRKPVEEAAGGVGQ